MSLSHSIAKNTVVHVAGKVIGTVIGLLTIGMMFRYLSDDGYGAFTSAFAYLQVFGTLIDFGLTLTMLSMLSKPGANEDRIASNILTLRVVSGIVFFASAPLLALVLPYSPDIRQAITLGTLSFFAITFTQVLTSVFQRHLAAHLAAITEVVCRLILLAGIAVGIRLDSGLLGMVGAVTLSNVVQAVMSLVFAARFVRLRPAFDMAIWKDIMRESLPIGISIAFNLVYLKGDLIALSFTRSQAEVGRYGAAYKILDVITIVPMIFMGLVMPVLTASWASGAKEDFRRRLSKAFDALSALAVPLSFGTPFVAEKVMLLIGGADAAGSGTYLAILMLAAATVFWGTLFGHAIVSLGLQKPMIAAYAIDAAICLGLYIWLIPRFGGVAAAWITVLSEALLALIAGAVVLWKAKVKLPLTILSRTVAASGIMAGALWLTPGLSVLLQLPMALAIYAASLWALGGIDKETVRMFMNKKPAAA